MITIYGKVSCKYCTKAKELLCEQGVSFTYVSLTEYPEQATRLKADGFTTIPAIYGDGDYVIGGYDDLVEYFKFM